MTKLELGRLAQESLDLQPWRLNARAPGNIVFTRKIERGEDTLFLHPSRGVYSLSFGHCVSAKRTYDCVSNVLASAIPAGSAPYEASSFQVVSRQVTDMYFAEIINPSDFDPYLPTARAMVHEDVLPQLERYRYLGPLHERIAAADLQEIRSFMPSTGIGSQPHIAIIKHLVGAPDAAHYISDLIERLTAAGLNYTEDVERLENIQKVLNNVAPLSPQQIWGNHS